MSTGFSWHKESISFRANSPLVGLPLSHHSALIACQILYSSRQQTNMQKLVAASEVLLYLLPAYMPVPFLPEEGSDAPMRAQRVEFAHAVPWSRIKTRYMGTYFLQVCPIWDQLHTKVHQDVRQSTCSRHEAPRRLLDQGTPNSERNDSEQGPNCQMRASGIEYRKDFMQVMTRPGSFNRLLGILR
jgi:hypothetical protein